jgi:hypothetical protein
VKRNWESARRNDPTEEGSEDTGYQPKWANAIQPIAVQPNGRMIFGAWLENKPMADKRQNASKNTVVSQPSGPTSKSVNRKSRERANEPDDRATLEKLIPEETIAIEAGDNNWSTRQTILDGAERFAKGGGKLVKLEFPKTEIQVYGNTAVVYSNYSYELDTGGQRINQSGRVIEVFVLRKGQWVNPGWHMDSGK